MYVRVRLILSSMPCRDASLDEKNGFHRAEVDGSKN